MGCVYDSSGRVSAFLEGSEPALLRLMRSRASRALDGPESGLHASAAEKDITTKVLESVQLQPEPVQQFESDVFLGYHPDRAHVAILAGIYDHAPPALALAPLRASIAPLRARVRTACASDVCPATGRRIHRDPGPCGQDILTNRREEEENGDA